MPVPAEDTVCRFIRQQDWNKRDKRPKTQAFKQAGLSLWHQKRLCDKNILLEELQIENLAGSGQSHHKVGDYLEFACRSVTEEGEDSLRVQVEWRPEDEFVMEPWREWRFAHAQVEARRGPKQFTLEFRRLLALNARLNIPPSE